MWECVYTFNRLSLCLLPIQAQTLAELFPQQFRWASNPGHSIGRANAVLARTYSRIVKEMSDVVVGYFPGARTRVWESQAALAGSVPEREVGCVCVWV